MITILLYKGISIGMTEGEEIFPVMEWSTFDGPVMTARKTPTQIAYIAGQDSKAWGYNFKPDMRPCAWMKYHLDKNSHTSQYDDPKLLTHMEEGLFSIPKYKVAEDITVDYLKEVLKYTAAYLADSFSEAILSVTSIKFWLTKPAIWGDEAKVKLLRAVEAAAQNANFWGIRKEDEYGLLSEPEAAAFATLADQEEDDIEVHKTAQLLYLKAIVVLC
jgi:hypothetical protein